MTASEARRAGGGVEFSRLDRAMALVGTALAPSLAQAGPRIFARSDPMLACFPGGGARYGAHYDGGNDERCKLTSICYANPDWSEADGGHLLMLDERGGPERCWRSVKPSAGRLVIFRSELMLHKVTPSYARRFAATCFWFVPGPATGQLPPGIVLAPARDDETGEPLEEKRVVLFSECQREAALLCRI